MAELNCLHRADIPQPSRTRPTLAVLERLDWDDDLFSGNPTCEHYVVMKWSGVMCVRCNGWFCA